jgi:transketolase
MNVSVPADALETQRATEHMLFHLKGPKYLRFAREATPVVSRPDTPFIWGVPNVYRYRGEKPNFIDAFEVKLGTEYKNEHENLSIVACGPMIPEALRAAWILKEEFGLETRVINMHTLKPFNPQVIVEAAFETGIVVTAEEHQVGGLANWVSHALHVAPELYGHPVAFGAVGVKDRFGESGQPWELMWEFEVSGEHIAAKAKELYDFSHAAKAKPKPAAKPTARKPAVRKTASKKPKPDAEAGGGK